MRISPVPRNNHSADTSLCLFNMSNKVSTVIAAPLSESWRFRRFWVAESPPANLFCVSPNSAKTADILFLTSFSVCIRLRCKLLKNLIY
nr:MAG TPA: hypothetical protein [Caudoviricetes sp.]